MTAFVDLTSRVFGRLTVVSYAGLTRNRTSWNCECECGNSLVVVGDRLKDNNTRSCGCLKIELARTHGHSKPRPSPTYRSWHAMVGRCTRKYSGGYARYGGRGITICERWMKFENFLADMGERPKGHTLDRYPNCEGNYEPGNCRWATLSEQARNRSDNRLLVHDGKCLTMAEWCEHLGMSVSTLRNRLGSMKMSVGEALTRPVAHRRTK